MSRTSILLTVFVATFSVQVGQALADPHSDGLSLGQSQLNNLSGNVNSTNAQNVPNYNVNPPQSAQFGASSLFTVGTARISSCQTEQPGSDRVKNQECGAVNFLAKNPQERVKIPISNSDPIIVGIGNTINNATAGAVTDICQDKTSTTPDIYSTEVCNEYNLSDDKTCSMGQIVEVKAESNYQCNVTTNALETFSCDNTLVVKVQMACAPNTTFPVLDLPRSNIDHVYIYAQCDQNALTNSYIMFTADAFGVRGGNARNQSVQVPKNISQIPAGAWVDTVGAGKGYLIATTFPNWEGDIQTVPVYILPDSTGCVPNSSNCSYHFYWEWVIQSDDGDYINSSNSGWATSVMGQINITYSWDDQCSTLESRS